MMLDQAPECYAAKLSLIPIKAMLALTGFSGLPGFIFSRRAEKRNALSDHVQYEEMVILSGRTPTLMS